MLDLRAEPPFPLNGMLSLPKASCVQVFDMLRAQSELDTQAVRNALQAREASASVLAVLGKIESEVSTRARVDAVHELVAVPAGGVAAVHQHGA